MSKLTSVVSKPTNGGSSKEENAVLAAAKTILIPEKTKIEEKTPLLKIEPEKVAVSVPEPKKEMTLIEKILKIENLQLVVEKRTKLVQTRSELERFQVFIQ